MINDNIKRYRKEKGMSQEELAVHLHVVRQTVSKWEKGLSVPDAEVLVRMAELLDVPVSHLLGMEVSKEQTGELTEELSRVNEELIKKNRQMYLEKQAGEKRGLILFLSFVSMFVVLSVKQPVVSILLSGGCILGAVMVLYRNLTLLTRISTEDMRLPILRLTTGLNIGCLVFAMGIAVLMATDVIHLSEKEEEWIVMFLVAGIMIFMGVVSPKLPFTRHTGLRLPWTVRDEETWNLAHRIIGVISLPLALLYVGCALTMEAFEMVTVIAMLCLIGIPGGISYIFYWKKLYGKRK